MDIQMFLNTLPMLYPEEGLESYATLMSCFWRWQGRVWNYWRKIWLIVSTLLSRRCQKFLQPGLIACVIVLGNLALLQNGRLWKEIYLNALTWLWRCLFNYWLYRTIHWEAIASDWTMCHMAQVQGPQHWKRFDCPVTTNVASLCIRYTSGQ